MIFCSIELDPFIVRTITAIRMGFTDGELRDGLAAMGCPGVSNGQVLAAARILAVLDERADAICAEVYSGS